LPDYVGSLGPSKLWFPHGQRLGNKEPKKMMMGRDDHPSFQHLLWKKLLRSAEGNGFMGTPSERSVVVGMEGDRMLPPV
jgi:hypothetical protein